jgi:hypothetical protein
LHRTVEVALVSVDVNVVMVPGEVVVISMEEPPVMLVGGVNKVVIARLAVERALQGRISPLEFSLKTNVPVVENPDPAAPPARTNPPSDVCWTELAPDGPLKALCQTILPEPSSLSTKALEDGVRKPVVPATMKPPSVVCPMDTAASPFPP